MTSSTEQPIAFATDRVRFGSQGDTLVADLFRPVTADPLRLPS
jgi:hypothetical protein